TLTRVIIALSGFDIGAYFALLAFIGVVVAMASKNDKVKRIGFAVTGLGLMFVGLSFMSSAFNSSETLSHGLRALFVKVDFPLVLILVGIVCTALFQSSTAMTALVVTMAAPTVINGVVGAPIIPMQSALFVILGTNIGTCVTALIASFGASTNAKRTAIIHLLFNAIGTVVFTTFIWIFQSQVVRFFNLLTSSTQMQVALFHVFFNVITTAMLVPFIKPLTKLATLLVREKADDESILKMQYIDDRILHTPPIAVAQVLKEVQHMATLAYDNLDRGFNAVITGSLAEREKIKKEEEKINFINKGVARYLIKMSSLNLTHSDEKLVGSLHHVIGDLERIGDHAENFLEQAEEMQETDVTFSDDAVGELTNMYNKVRDMFEKSVHVFINRSVEELSQISEIESEVDTMKRILGNNHIMRLNNGNCSVESGTHFYALITALERVADHLTNVAFSIKSPSGSQVEAREKIARENAKHRHGGEEKAH
ncbi:MAG: Na/Pi symporter, partial [Clostridiales bacterium]|nr:Na/Pi symporter [Clostridiales bacterium]